MPRPAAAVDDKAAVQALFSLLRQSLSDSLQLEGSCEGASNSALRRQDQILDATVERLHWLQNETQTLETLLKTQTRSITGTGTSAAKVELPREQQRRRLHEAGQRQLLVLQQTQQQQRRQLASKYNHPS